MAKMNWYVKEFSKLTGVSVRTLHHYDHIGLLIPSQRLENGYRKYSEKDLLKQQQIIALKSFGFELTQIKDIISKKISLVDHLGIQSKILEEKASSLLSASKALKDVISNYCNNKSINWKTTIELIEVYRMTAQLEKTWMGKVFDDKELKDYAKLEHELKHERPATKIAFEKRWLAICNEIKEHLHEDPNGDIGIEIGEKTHFAVYNLYGQKYASLKNSIWEKGFMSGANQTDDSTNLTPEIIQWLDSAMSTYWQNRNRNILKKIGQVSDNILIEEFSASLSEMYGSETQLKKDLFEAIFKLDEVPEKSKSWIKKYMESLV